MSQLQLQLYVDTSSFIGLFDEKTKENLMRNLPEIKEGRISLFISPYVIEEFFHTIFYKEEETPFLQKLVGNPKSKIGEKVNYFFTHFKEKFPLYLNQFKMLEIKGEIPIIFLDEEVMRNLTEKTRTYDLLHLFTSIISGLDGILTSDFPFFEWIKNNKETIMKYIQKTKSFFVFYFTKEKFESFEIKAFE